MVRLKLSRVYIAMQFYTNFRLKTRKLSYHGWPVVSDVKIVSLLDLLSILRICLKTTGCTIKVSTAKFFVIVFFGWLVLISRFGHPSNKGVLVPG